MRKLLKQVAGAALLALSFCIFTAQTSSATVVPESCYEFDAGTITDYDAGCASDPEIPSTIGGQPVTAISGIGFRQSNLTAVTIPSSVLSIGADAFSTNNLTSITIPTSVTNIDHNAFEDNQLTSVVIPSSVIQMGTGVFADNNLTSVTIPSSLTTIRTSTFENNNLTSVTIPSSITVIEDAAFRNNQLTSVSLPGALISINNNAFSNNKLASITIPSSVINIGMFAFQSNQLTSVAIPSSITTINIFAFSMNKLTSVTIPNSVTTIGQGAFQINQLTSVTIPSSVTSLDASAFTFQGPYSDYSSLLTDPVQLAALIDALWYVRVITSNPANPQNLADSAVTEDLYGTDFNNDGDQNDSLGGHIINPVRVTLSYLSDQGAEILPQATFTGTDLDDYRAAENTANDLSLYYHLGQTYTLSPPQVTGYVSPPAANLAFSSQTNTFSFTYAQAGSSALAASSTQANAGSGLADTGSSQSFTLLIALLSMPIFIAILSFRMTSRNC